MNYRKHNANICDSQSFFSYHISSKQSTLCVVISQSISTLDEENWENEILSVKQR